MFVEVFPRVVFRLLYMTIMSSGMCLTVLKIVLGDHGSPVSMPQTQTPRARSPWQTLELEEALCGLWQPRQEEGSGARTQGAGAGPPG